MSSEPKFDVLKAVNYAGGAILIIAAICCIMLSPQFSGFGHSAKDLPDGEFKRLVSMSDKPVLVDFYTDWCGPCKYMSSILDEFIKEQSNVQVVRINIDKEQDLAVYYGINCIPTLMVFKEGKVTARRTGVADKKTLSKMVEQ